MEIVFYFKTHSVHLQFGYKTLKWHSLYWFSRIKQYYDDENEVEYASMDWCLFRRNVK